MNRRRISVALVAVTASALALVTPAQAQDPTPTPVPGQQESPVPEPPDEEPTEPAPTAPTDADEAPAENEGSSFMGPDELLRSILGGHGSSGAPEDREPDNGEDEDDDEIELPEWAASAETPLTILGMVLSVGAAVAQAAVVLLPLMPGGVDMLRDTLRDFGIPLPSDNA
ncbi:hypothetical protein [Corynebacterium halotolerans]|uniref:Secreted protein n=1 Tax=Corynebacterium halotolerans YIM 70093 = DSM 44683 TaxID=1121362 RepID=M1P868_9CORY|nr:hypothetical protein [Corynebacterium halotolerans]AGF72866.1 hypothetical protein A605_09320 [Corynebacterium halotolerans YIM 70093 = DSM 44683]